MRLSELRNQINDTLEQPALDPEILLDACQRLSEQILRGDYQAMLEAYGLADDISASQIQEASRLLSRSCLLQKAQVELGDAFRHPCRLPLGVLFHIGAGNMEGLPAYSVIEGLLAGNINLLKLPEGDSGISAFLLNQLIRMAPILSRYIYVFRIPSSNTKRLRQLADLSDAVVIWGGDEAVRSVRSWADPGTKIIQWGHKISFAYITPAGICDHELKELAAHMVSTRQLLCSSCQGIYLDTADPQLLRQFCRHVLTYLDLAAAKMPPTLDVTAQNSIRIQEARLVSMMEEGMQVYKGTFSSVLADLNPRLESSLLFGNCWVKPLPRSRILPILRPYKGYLQTVGLFCGEGERDHLAHLFFRAGATRIKGADMSGISDGESHDGEYPLRRYSKIVTNDYFIAPSAPT